MTSTYPENDEPTTPALGRRTILKGVAGASALLGAGTGLASAHAKPHRLVLEALDEDVEYRVEVSGEIERGPRASHLKAIRDEIRDGNVAVGAVDAGNVDDFWFSGQIVAFRVTGALDARVEREAAEKKAKQKEHEVVIKAHGAHLEYRIEVSGDIERGPRASHRKAIRDEIRDGNVAVGAVDAGNVDDFRFTGKITKIDLSHKDATVIDGEVVHDP